MPRKQKPIRQTQLRWAVVFIFSCLVCFGGIGHSNAALIAIPDAGDGAVMQALADHVQQLDDVNATAKREAEQKLADESLDPIDRLTETLGCLYPAYAAAIATSDQGGVQEAVDQLMPLVDQSDQFLSADASFYLARTLMNDEQFESALPLLESLTNELSKVSLHGDVVSYYTGCLLYTSPSPRDATLSRMPSSA